MDDILQLMSERRERVVLNSNKAFNVGFTELRKWDGYYEDMADCLSEALCFMQMNFHKVTPSSEAGQANLTSIVITLGEIVTNTIGTYDEDTIENWEIKGHIGASIVDTLWRLDYIP